MHRFVNQYEEGTIEGPLTPNQRASVSMNAIIPFTLVFLWTDESCFSSHLYCCIANNGGSHINSGQLF